MLFESSMSAHNFMDLTEDDDEDVVIEILPAKDIPGYQQERLGIGAQGNDQSRPFRDNSNLSRYLNEQHEQGNLLMRDDRAVSDLIMQNMPPEVQREQAQIFEKIQVAHRKRAQPDYGYNAAIQLPGKVINQQGGFRPQYQSMNQI